MDSDIFDLIKKANETTLKKHGDEISLERAIFLSWWCDKGDCAFCYMSTQKDKIKEIVSISPQESAFAPNLNIYQNLVFSSLGVRERKKGLRPFRFHYISLR